MIFSRKFPGVAIVAASLLVLASCQRQDKWTKQRPKVVPVSGVVLYQGQPVSAATVLFLNAASATTAHARTGDDGRFKLTTFEQDDGAVPGPQQVAVHKVEVRKRANADIDRTTASPKVSRTLPSPEERWLIPKRYGDFATSGLTFEVTEGAKNDLVVELQEKP